MTVNNVSNSTCGMWTTYMWFLWRCPPVSVDKYFCWLTWFTQAAMYCYLPWFDQCLVWYWSQYFHTNLFFFSSTFEADLKWTIWSAKKTGSDLKYEHWAAFKRFLFPFSSGSNFLANCYGLDCSPLVATILLMVANKPLVMQLVHIYSSGVCQLFRCWQKDFSLGRSCVARKGEKSWWRPNKRLGVTRESQRNQST